MSRVTVNGQVLKWAVERSGKTFVALENKFPRIREWQMGESHPTLRQLESLARATLTPLGFFFLSEPPEDRLPVPYFRTVGDEAPKRPSPDLLQTMQMMQRRQAWIREYLREEGQEQIPFVRSAHVGDNVGDVAQRIRRTLGFDDGWAELAPTWTVALRVLRQAMESVGILVFVNGVVGNNTHRKLRTDEFRGFVLVDEYAPLVFVNGTDTKAAQMFTLAHELAHIFVGKSAAFDLEVMQPANDPVESICNRVAAEFLVPEQQLRRAWPNIKNSTESFTVIGRLFKVSVLVAARRALDLGLIHKGEFLAFYDAYQMEARRKGDDQEGGGNYYANQNLRIGELFASTVIRAAKEGKLSYSDAFELTGLYGQTFDNFAALLETEGNPR